MSAENVATDLESFSNHAGRTTVTTDDVLLLARKNPDLHGIMEEFVDELRVEREALKGKASTTTTTTAKGKGKGKGKAR